MAERRDEGKTTYFRARAPKRIEVYRDAESGEVLRRVAVYG